MGESLWFKQKGPAIRDMVDLGTRLQNRGGSLLVESRTGRNTAIIEGVSSPAAVGQGTHDIGIVNITADVFGQNRPVVAAGVLQFMRELGNSRRHRSMMLST